MVGPPLPLILTPDDDDDDDGIPVNCCTIARKLLVSVLSSVTGARLEARDLRLGDFPTRPRPGGLPLPEVAVKSGMDMDVMDEILMLGPPAEAWLWL